VFPVDSFKMVDPRKVLFGDFNGDGRLDMFIACHGWDTNPYPGEQNRLYLSEPGGGWRDATATLPLRLLEPPVHIDGFAVSQLWHERSEHDAGVVWLRALMTELSTFQPRAAKRTTGSVAKRRTALRR
jgi:hypothetical protein